MKIKHYLLLLIWGSLLTQLSLRGQHTDSQNDSTRKVFVYSGLGLPELFNIGIGYQVSQKIAISVKQSISFTGGGNDNFFSSAAGFGTKISYFFPSSSVLFNCIFFEGILYYELSTTQQPPPIIKGGFIELSLGKEIIDEKGLRVFYGVGLYRSVAIGVQPDFSLSFKLGINYNIF